MHSLQELSDEKLIEAFEMAKESALSDDFISLLESEMKTRGLSKLAI